MHLAALVSVPVAGLAVMAAEDAGPLPDTAQYGLAGLLFSVLMIGAGWWARDARRREDLLRADNLAMREEIKALNDRIASDVVPALLRVVDLQERLEDLRRRDRR